MPSVFTSRLFENFPVISYGGQTAINITTNINMVANLVSNAVALTPYVLNQSQRSDQVARKFYGDPYLEWLIFMANQQIDGCDWFMDQSQFYSYLNTKYGDWVLTQQTVAYWINNWYDSPSISVSTFDSLDPRLVKYYEPQFNAAYQVVAYNRAEVDWVISTNHLVQYSFANTVTVPAFTNNEVVTVNWGFGNTSSGQICYQNNTPGSLALNIQHVKGPYNFANTIDPVAFSITGARSNAVLTIPNVNAVSFNVYDTVSAVEDVFYDPVTIFDDENMKNQNRAYIYYLANSYSQQVTTELTNLLTGA